mgnify:CR=1 FL=1
MKIIPTKPNCTALGLIAPTKANRTTFVLRLWCYWDKLWYLLPIWVFSSQLDFWVKRKMFAKLKLCRKPEICSKTHKTGSKSHNSALTIKYLPTQNWTKSKINSCRNTDLETIEKCCNSYFFWKISKILNQTNNKKRWFWSITFFTAKFFFKKQIFAKIYIFFATAEKS